MLEFVESTILPNLLANSLNPAVHSNLTVIHIELMVHLDGCGPEVFFQVMALSPKEIPNLFGKYGHSKAEVVAGYAGAEGHYVTYLKSVLKELVYACRKFYTTKRFPNSLIKFSWTKFSADRHASGPSFGWKICNATYPSGVTCEDGLNKHKKQVIK